MDTWQKILTAKAAYLKKAFNNACLKALFPMTSSELQGGSGFVIRPENQRERGKMATDKSTAVASLRKTVYMKTSQVGRNDARTVPSQFLD